MIGEEKGSVAISGRSSDKMIGLKGMYVSSEKGKENRCVVFTSSIKHEI